MSNREKFLNNIKAKLTHTYLPEATAEHPGAFQPADGTSSDLVGQFSQELETIAGYVHVLEDIEDIAAKILQILQHHQAQRIMAWDDASLGLPGLRSALTEAGISITDQHVPADAEGRTTELAALDDVLVGLTGADGGLADTGAVALISGPNRGRLASLLPPVHIALLSRKKLYPSITHFLAATPNAAVSGSNLVFIAGPSRSGDIELSLSMGVHGPGEVHVIITP